MKALDLLEALGQVSEKRVRPAVVFTRTGPTWRVMMKKTTKFAVSAAAVVLVLGFIFGAWYLQTYYGIAPGAAPQKETLTDEPVTLRIVTEQTVAGVPLGSSNRGVMTALTETVNYFKAQHPNVSIKWEFLPAKGEERNVALGRIRTKMMAGEGPDVYLLPAGELPLGDFEETNRIYNSDGEYIGSGGRYQPVEPLFQDVTAAMRNGRFYDLTSYYDTDVELRTQELHQQVMDGGVLEGRRLVLPLGWNMNVLLVDTAGMTAAGFTEDDLPKTQQELRELAVERDDPMLLYAVGDAGLTEYGPLWDYDANRVLLTEEELTRSLSAIREAELGANSHRDWYEEKKENTTGSVTLYLVGESIIGERYEYRYGDEVWLDSLTLADTLDAYAIGRVESRDIKLLPQTTADGKVTASITYWGAVDANTAHPGWAYELLRLFLTPEVQLQQGLDNGEYDTRIDDIFGTALPVRVTGAGKRLLDLEMAVLSSGNTQRRQALKELELSDEELLLTFPVDRVYFPGEMERLYEELVTKVKDPAVTENQLSELATGFLKEMQYHLDES